MIHEIFPHKFDNHFVIVNDIAENDYVLQYNERALLLKVNGDGFELPQKKDLSSIVDTANSTFLFSLNGVHCFLIWSDTKVIHDRFVYKEISSLRVLKPQEVAWVGIVGFQLQNWYLENKFCGKCGSKTKEKPDERAIVCPDCGTLVFPKISPAIIVAILCKDKILLAHNSNFEEKRYSLVAGYADVGESLEETVMREVKEEVGLEVKNIRYYKSQPWAFSGSLMIGFIAEADDIQDICPDMVEITDASWFSRDNLPNHPPKVSIAGEMIDKFEKGELMSFS
jgi:NAD+ diphosphatase